ncbi:MAG TPA: RNA-binding protein [Candidatus Methylomirabilis sp.]|jgi:RNA recognition motif-containing protein|nr:RNA-binding protein [Candidatus Methylomirabilis sp.]
MGSRVYVGNLPFTVDAQELRTLFEEEGRQVQDVKIITDRDTGRPRGFAFVEMATPEQAEAAIAALNGRTLGGRALTVSMAREREPRGGGDRYPMDRGRGGDR